MKKNNHKKVFVIGAAVLMTLMGFSTISVASPPDELSREDVWPFYPPPYVIGILYCSYGALMMVDMDGDGDADYYVSRHGEVFGDVDGDGIIDFCFEPDGDLILLYDDAPEPDCTEREGGWHGVDVDCDGFFDAWIHPFYYGVYMDLDSDGVFDCSARYGWHPMSAGGIKWYCDPHDFMPTFDISDDDLEFDIEEDAPSVGDGDPI